MMKISRRNLCSLEASRMACNTVVQRALQLAERTGYLLPPAGCPSGHQDQEHIQFGPVGQLLKKNVHQEWFRSNVVDTLDNTFLLDEQFTAQNSWEGLHNLFEFAKQKSGHQLPFGFAEIRPNCSPLPDLQQSGEMSFFTPQKSILARTCKFERPTAAMRMFHYWQRQRKMWWRKFSIDPSRFTIVDAGQSGNDVEALAVNIVFSSPDLPPLVVETVRQLKDAPFIDMPADMKSTFEIKDGRKKVLPHMVESCTTLETAALALFVDALEDRDHKSVLAFHRKLAPYKVGFVCDTLTDSSSSQDVLELAGFLNRVLKRGNISTLMLPDFGKCSLKSQVERNDELGVPYSIVLKETVLKNGIMGLRNRDTSLEEQVHAAELKKYIQMLMKNY